jgi:hypothetical protein
VHGYVLLSIQAHDEKHDDGVLDDHECKPSISRVLSMAFWLFRRSLFEKDCECLELQEFSSSTVVLQHPTESWCAEA